MPRFKYRNLLIDVLPESGTQQREFTCDLFASCGWTICLGCTGAITEACAITQCGGCTLQVTRLPCDFHCTQIPSGACFPCTNISPLESRRALGPNDLALLKERLRDALSEVEAQEQAAEERMRPRNLDEVELLEGQLRDALAALQAQKEEMLQDAEDGE